MTKKDIVYRAVAEAYARTASEVALETGLPVKTVSAYLSSLEKQRKIHYVGDYPQFDDDKGLPKKMYEPLHPPSSPVQA